MKRFDSYVADVLDGRRVAGKLEILAVERHVRDLDEGPKRGLHFDPGAAQRVIRYLEMLRLYEGQWRGQFMRLAPWQVFCIGSVFGWKRDDGLRRFRRAYDEVARKNGKSSMLAGLADYMLMADGEQQEDDSFKLEGAPQVWSAATGYSQASIVLTQAGEIAKMSGLDGRHLRVLMDRILCPRTSGYFRALHAKHGRLDGWNPHFGIVDEMHEHPDRGLWDVLDSGMGSRRQPLLWGITTAGVGTTGFCREMHDYAEDVLRGEIEDDNFFAIIYTIDEDDDWHDRECWPKANPGLGYAKLASYLDAQYTEAKNQPSKRADFQRKQLNIWTSSYEAWLTPEMWARGNGKIVEAELEGRPCYAGLDVGSTQDLTAASLAFPPVEAGERWKLVRRVWCPEENLDDRASRDRVPYRAWADAGLIRLIPGEVFDDDFALAELDELAKVFWITALYYDPWSARNIANKLSDGGMTCIELRPTIANLSPVCKWYEKKLMLGEINHGEHPVLTWMAGNVQLYRDANDNVRPQKAKSKGRIDGIMADLSALYPASQGSDEEKKSVYDDPNFVDPNG